MSAPRILASAAASIAVGVTLFHTEIALTEVLLNVVFIPLGMFPLRWQENICSLFLAVLFSIPIGAVAQRNAAWFGALAGVTTEVCLIAYWALSPAPRAQFSALHFPLSLVYAGLFALFSASWWKYAFSRLSGRIDGG